jgi:hypothetical protein
MTCDFSKGCLLLLVVDTCEVLLGGLDRRLKYVAFSRESCTADQHAFQATMRGPFRSLCVDISHSPPSAHAGSHA